MLRTSAVLLTCGCAAVAHAQTPDDPVETARVQFGPLGLTPSIALTNFGVDGNVFNQVEDPKRDFTFTVSPRLDSWFRAGRSRLTAESRADLVYFHTFSSERSLDGEVDARWDIRWNRLTPWVAGGFSSGRQRVDFEIDLRSRRQTRDVAFGADVRVGSKTWVGASAQRTKLAHDADAFFLGSRLQTFLNRTSESVGVQYRQNLTPLTTFVLTGEAIRDRFEYSPERDSEGTRFRIGLDLDEAALISGRARVGFRKFDGVGGGVPSFTGVIASASVATTLKGRARLEFGGERDVVYSFELGAPYYLLTGGTLMVTPRLSTLWDIQGRAGAQRLAYRVAVTSAETPAGRVDQYTLLGGGVGYHVGRAIRVGLNLDYQRRASRVQLRDFKGYRIGTAVTYGR